MQAKPLIAAVLLSASLGVGGYIGWDYFETQKQQTVHVLTVSDTIPPRTLITKEMFDSGIIKVTPHLRDEVPPNVYSKPEEVIGKYTTTNYTVPKYSYIYQGYVLSPEEIQDGAALRLKEGEKLYALTVNLKSSLAAQIVEDSYIQPWLVAESRADRAAVVGPFLDKVRVIGTYATSSQKVTPSTGLTPQQEQKIKQQQQNGIQSTPTTYGANLVPQTILVAVNDNQAAYIQLAEKLGVINVVGLGQNPVTKNTDAQFSIGNMQSWMKTQLSKGFVQNGTVAANQAVKQ